jgi:hypothetical protein
MEKCEIGYINDSIMLAWIRGRMWIMISDKEQKNVLYRG